VFSDHPRVKLGNPLHILLHLRKVGEYLFSLSSDSIYLYLKLAFAPIQKDHPNHLRLGEVAPTAFSISKAHYLIASAEWLPKQFS
jgi:hypothetical protein